MKGFNIKRQYYAMASTDGVAAEIQLYGDVCETWPKNYWTGQKLEGSYITQDEFLKDLKAVEKCKSLTIRLNSYGGDCVVGYLIHNKIRELAAKGVETTCIIDAVAMSAGSIIASACDKVIVNSVGLVMVHKCWSLLIGGYNADELRESAGTMDAYDKAMAAAYARKTGMPEADIMAMMAETTYMTGREAVEKGFADELAKDESNIKLAASADGRSLFAGNRQIHLCPGMFAPDNIPTIEPEAQAPVAINTNQPEVTGSEEGGISMTMEELRAKHPELVAQVENEARAGVDNTAAVNAAVEAELERLQAIDEVAGLFDDALVAEARYGEKKCSAQELAYRAAQAAAQKGQKFLSAMKSDAEDSGANGVGAAPGGDDGGEENVEASAKAAAAAYLKMKEGK